MDFQRQSEKHDIGLTMFLKFAFSKLSPTGKILCPCVKCCMRISMNKTEAYTYLKVDGFIKCYTNWIAHAETLHNNSSMCNLEILLIGFQIDIVTCKT